MTEFTDFTDLDPKQPDADHTPVFTIGDTVIVTTRCDEIALHGLTGKVTLVGASRIYKGKTSRTVYVKMDIDGSRMCFDQTEVGHYF